MRMKTRCITSTGLQGSIHFITHIIQMSLLFKNAFYIKSNFIILIVIEKQKQNYSSDNLSFELFMI